MAWYRQAGAQRISGRLNDGRPAWIRTIDLFGVNSVNEVCRTDSEQEQVTPKDSVHAGLAIVPGPLTVRRRHLMRWTDMGRDRAVTTQFTTQISDWPFQLSME